jgi:hypothetical protein
MFRNVHAVALAAAAGAGLLLASASPSLACIFVTVNPSCTESADQSAHGGGMFYDQARSPGKVYNRAHNRSARQIPAGEKTQ